MQEKSSTFFYKKSIVLMILAIDLVKSKTLHMVVLAS